MIIYGFCVTLVLVPLFSPNFMQNIRKNLNTVNPPISPLGHPCLSDPVESNPVSAPVEKVLKFLTPVKSNLISGDPGEKPKWLLNPVRIPHVG